jgi:hypothetical protein
MKFLKGAFIAVTSLIAVASVTPANATLITFDELPTAPAFQVTNGYDGLNWINFDYLDATVIPYTSGYGNGLKSGKNVGYNPNGGSAGFSYAGTFDFVSGYFTAAWNNGLSITAVGLLNGVIVDTTSFTVNATGPTFKTFNWTGIDEVDFSSGGGTSAGYHSSPGPQTAFDNLTVTNFVAAPDPVPEPVTLSLFGAGLAGAFAARRKTRKS